MRWIGGFPSKFPFGYARILSAMFGICSVAWAISAISVYQSETAFATAAQHILSGDKYKPEQMSLLKLQLDTTPASSLRPSSLSDVAAIRLRMAETGLMSGNAQLSSVGLDNLETAVTAALAENPTSSFLWLTKYWLETVRTGSPAADLKFLRMSYALGPNEGWIALRRSPLALSAFSSLPEGLAAQAIAEFTGLVRSGLYFEAANILAGAGWAVHDKLLAGLVRVDEGGRRRFAKALESKDLDGVVVPGVEERPSRPF
jgi:hypothetical protein